jgi:putative salt-induced outer membrane protein
MKLIFVLALVPVALAAQDSTKAPPPPPPPPPAVTFHGDLGYVATSGNTQVSTINFADQLTWHTSSVNKIDEVFSVVYGSNKNVVQTNIWSVALHDQYAFTPQIGVYGLGTFDRNTFAGTDYRFAEGAGLAITPVLPKRHHLEIDLGALYVEQKLLPDSTDHHPEAQGGIIYKYTFLKDAYFQQAVVGLPDLRNDQDFRINSQTDLVAPLSKHFALKFGYTIHYVNLPPPGFRTTDRLFTSDLQVSF